MSRVFTLNKLVRDGIVPSMLSSGQKPLYHKLPDTEKIAALKNKLLEEGAEDDLVDLLEVIEALQVSQGGTFEELRAAQLQKREKIGGFNDGTYVGKLTLGDDDPWVEYYAAEPERFPETPE